jgi:hypothetical protein
VKRSLSSSEPSTNTMYSIARNVVTLRSRISAQWPPGLVKRLGRALAPGHWRYDP